MKKMLIFIVAALLISTTVYAGTIHKVPFETIDKGYYSHYDENYGQHIIEIYNQNDWQSFWDKHTATDPASELPEIDFQEYIVIIAMDAMRNTGGYDLRIKEIFVDTASENKPFKVNMVAEHPGSAALVTFAFTRPYHIVKIKI